MYASSPITIRKAWEYETCLLNLRFSGSLDIVSARRVLDKVDIINMRAMVAVTGMMPACWNRSGKAPIAGPLHVLAISAKEPMRPMDFVGCEVAVAVEGGASSSIALAVDGVEPT
jgi:hypothetical protein